MDWDPTTEEEVAQNVRSLVATAQGSQPMARSLGMPIEAVDAQVQAAKARVAAALQRQILTHERRAEVARILVEHDGEGRLVPTVRLR